MSVVIVSWPCCCSTGCSERSATPPTSLEIDTIVIDMVEIRFGSVGYVPPGPWSSNDPDVLEGIRQAIASAERTVLESSSSTSPIGTLWPLEILTEDGESREIRTALRGHWYYYDRTLGKYVKLVSDDFIAIKAEIFKNISLDN